MKKVKANLYTISGNYHVVLYRRKGYLYSNVEKHCTNVTKAVDVDTPLDVMNALSLEYWKPKVTKIQNIIFFREDTNLLIWYTKRCLLKVITVHGTIYSEYGPTPAKAYYKWSYLTI